MQILGFIIFLVISHFGVLQIFRFSTYHKYFWTALPFLTTYGALVAMLLFELEMHSFFLWQLLFSSLWLFYIGHQQAKTSEFLLQQLDDAEEIRAVAASSAMTSRYYSYSCFIYIIIFFFSYMWLIN